jgi:hypothetical protein
MCQSSSLLFSPGSVCTLENVANPPAILAASSVLPVEVVLTGAGGISPRPDVMVPGSERLSRDTKVIITPP